MDGRLESPRRKSASVQGCPALSSVEALLRQIRSRVIAQDDRLARIERQLGLLGDQQELDRLKDLGHAALARAAARGVRRIERAMGGNSPTPVVAEGGVAGERSDHS